MAKQTKGKYPRCTGNEKHSPVEHFDFEKLQLNLCHGIGFYVCLRDCARLDFSLLDVCTMSRLMVMVLRC